MKVFCYFKIAKDSSKWDETEYGVIDMQEIKEEAD